MAHSNDPSRSRAAAGADRQSSSEDEEGGEGGAREPVQTGRCQRVTAARLAHMESPQSAEGGERAGVEGAECAESMTSSSSASVASAGSGSTAPSGPSTLTSLSSLSMQRAAHSMHSLPVLLDLDCLTFCERGPRSGQLRLYNPTEKFLRFQRLLLLPFLSLLLLVTFFASCSYHLDFLLTYAFLLSAFFNLHFI